MAKAVLEHQKVASLLVAEALEAVIEWHAEGLVPLGPELTGDLRRRFVQGDFFAPAASAEQRRGSWHNAALQRPPGTLRLLRA
jgi:hypothetical protein